MKTFPIIGATALAMIACAHLQTTPRLEEARSEYSRATAGPAAKYSPAELATAKKYLDLAGDSLSTGDAKLVDDKAEVALLKVQSAEAIGRTQQAAAERDASLKQLNLTREQMLTQAQQQLTQTKEQLDKERMARNDAEANLAQSRQQLEQFAQVRDMARGTVITLSGGVLFETGKAELLPGAQDRLSRVADYLKNSPRGVVVEGYTDSTGSSSTNARLSERRAEAVRDFLVAQGVASERISAQGKGDSAPVASNGNASGRAMNRRVEIILQRPAGEPGPATSSVGGR
jgi:outer membrane protein OmpA-like peptidoglycan-associated protein